MNTNKLINKIQLFAFAYCAIVLLSSCNAAVAEESWLLSEGKVYKASALPEHIKQLFVTIKPDPLMYKGEKVEWELLQITELSVGEGMVYGATFLPGANVDVNCMGALVQAVGKDITSVRFGEELCVNYADSSGAPLKLVKAHGQKYILMDTILTTTKSSALNVVSLSGSEISSLRGAPWGRISVSGYLSGDVVAYGFGVQQFDDWKKIATLTEKYKADLKSIKRDLGVRGILPYYHREARGIFSAYFINESGKFEMARGGKWSKIYEDMASRLLNEIKGRKFKSKIRRVGFLVLFFSVLDGIEDDKEILSLYGSLPDELKNRVTSQGVVRYLELYGYSRISRVFGFGNK